MHLLVSKYSLLYLFYDLMNPFNLVTIKKLRILTVDFWILYLIGDLQDTDHLNRANELFFIFQNHVLA